MQETNIAAEGLLAAIGRRTFQRNGADVLARTVTLVDQATGRTDEFDVDDRRVNGELDASLHQLVRLYLSHGKYWNDTPQGRRPATVVKVVGCEPLAHASLMAETAPA
ncbi:MAG TPA: hypothetical protein VN085_06570 [Vicinamibacterales bacterium]|nr:hypothetical protein [Vicinamibacterales bacterium]